VNLVYYSNLTKNTERFVHKLEMSASRIEDGIPENSILVTPTYGNAGIPKPVLNSLKVGPWRNVVALIGTGNINFGDNYCAAVETLSAKLGVPILYKLELAGTPFDVSQTLEMIGHFEDASKRNAEAVSHNLRVDSL
jgi:protein involved in ribonucleotide reduction